MKTIAAIAAVLLAAAYTAADSAPAAPVAATVAAVGFDARALGAHSLSVNSLSEMQLVATASGRETLGRVVACALPAGAQLTVINKHGTPYAFAGAVGLASEWVDRPATASEQSRIAACAQR